MPAPGDFKEWTSTAPVRGLASGLFEDIATALCGGENPRRVPAIVGERKKDRPRRSRGGLIKGQPGLSSSASSVTCDKPPTQRSDGRLSKDLQFLDCEEIDAAPAAATRSERRGRGVVRDHATPGSMRSNRNRKTVGYFLARCRTPLQCIPNASIRRRCQTSKTHRAGADADPLQEKTCSLPRSR